MQPIQQKFARVVVPVVWSFVAFVSATPSLAQPPSPRLPRHIDERTMAAIKRGLDYLAQTQRNDGSWMSAGGYGSYPAVMTSLAGLALLASGSTPTEGPYSRNIRKAMEYMMNIADERTGLLAGPGSEGRSVYGHGFGMLFLAECYGMERDAETRKKLKTILDKAIALSVSAQSSYENDTAGGWYYTLQKGGDEGSTTVTQIQGLRAARNAGLKVPPEVIRKAARYLAICQNPDGGISYSFSSRGGSRPPISAAAVATLYAAGRYDDPMAIKCLDYITKTIVPEINHHSGHGHWFYTHFYMAQAMYQVYDARYDRYFPVLRDNLLKLQAGDGSWTGDGVGTVYGTGIACIILQLPFDYLPIFQR